MLLELPRGDDAEAVALADPKAMEVHGIPESEIHAAPRAAEVDSRLHDWCLEHGASEDKRALIAVGWNVGAFDMPFVSSSKSMPGRKRFFTDSSNFSANRVMGPPRRGMLSSSPLASFLTRL